MLMEYNGTKATNPSVIQIEQAGDVQNVVTLDSNRLWNPEMMEPAIISSQ